MNKHVHYDLAQMEAEHRAAVDKSATILRASAKSPEELAAAEITIELNEVQLLFGMAFARGVNAGVDMDDIGAVFGRSVGGLRANMISILVGHSRPAATTYLEAEMVTAEAILSGSTNSVAVSTYPMPSGRA